MKLKFFAVAILAALAFSACDDTTDGLGTSLTNNMDNIEVSDAAYAVTSQSIKADSVLTSGAHAVLGRMRDSETQAYVKGDYMSQFTLLNGYSLPSADSVDSKDANGEVYADSAYLQLTWEDRYGDSTQTMNVTAYEMSKPMNDQEYYSNFDALAQGYYSHDNYHVSKTYQLLGSNSQIKIPLNEPYAKDGVTYNNYGTYLLRQYYKNPENFSNTYRFIHNVTPGFYVESTGGIGNMAKIWVSEIMVYYRYKETVKSTHSGLDSLVHYTGYTRFDGTEEVLQTNKIENDEASLNRLISDNNCTYVKSPAGIFTELTIPVEEIVSGHEQDTLNTAKIVLNSINNTVESKYQLKPPSYVILLPKDSMYTFFENSKLYDNKTSYLAAYSSGSDAGYTFNNISGLINWMYQHHKAFPNDENWNKAVIVPVGTQTHTSQTGTKSIVRVTNDMGLNSVKLKKGTSSDPIKLSVIYSRFQPK